MRGRSRDRALQDAGFTLLHYVALLGHTTVAQALGVTSRGLQLRFARIAQYLVRNGHDVFVQDRVRGTSTSIGGGHVVVLSSGERQMIWNYAGAHATWQ